MCDLYTLNNIYFALSPKSPYPAPKLNIYSSHWAPNVEVVVQGLNTGLQTYGSYRGGDTMEQRVKYVFTHRDLNGKTGIFTFLGIGRKEDPVSKDLGLQARNYTKHRGSEGGNIGWIDYWLSNTAE
ncbi:uncharacterized protein BCR38DRAFT_509089 [Pseudomassariella vexata]|uniref:Uncharacterized protein n=1 Tax=Pseudomassariella vexata TaxID=1141098 RepID=A0A1Y2D694_9PEZI|nr:uncharacterized protein BCR38DRAFT_509089 [Pseudomassariella vexata]ORY54717.1 hypothetical protein BCR38DRAFT_509089 [Pseudomassariella vexata]